MALIGDDKIRSNIEAAGKGRTVSPEKRLAEKTSHIETCARLFPASLAPAAVALLCRRGAGGISDPGLAPPWPRLPANVPRVLERAKRLKEEEHRRKQFVATRAQRLADAAAHQRYVEAQQQRVGMLAPILKIVSVMSALGDRLNEHRVHIKVGDACPPRP